MVGAVAACMAAGMFGRENPQQVAEVPWPAVRGVVSLELAGHLPDADTGQRRFTELTSAAGAWFRTDAPVPGSHQAA
jgi:hypothetical protein